MGDHRCIWPELHILCTAIAGELQGPWPFILHVLGPVEQKIKK